MIKEIQKKDDDGPEMVENFGQNDLQLEEAYKIMKDLIFLMEQQGIFFPVQSKEAFSLSPSSEGLLN